MRYEDVSARPYTLNTINVEYIIGMITLSSYNDLLALGPDVTTQEPLERIEVLG